MALTAARKDRREDSSIRVRPLYQRCRGCRHLRPGHLVWIAQHDAQRGKSRGAQQLQSDRLVECAYIVSIAEVGIKNGKTQQSV
jgi:hypothetical protein